MSRQLASLESWLIHAAHDVISRGIADAHGSPSGRAFVGVQDVLTQVRRNLRDEAALGALFAGRSQGRSLDDSLAKAREDKQRAELEIPAWTAAAALRWHLEKRKNSLSIDTDAYDPVYDRPDA